MSDAPDSDTALVAAAGSLASGVIAELFGPLRDIREALAVLVETLDRHFAEARGPEPYPWVATKALRERIADTYLMSRAVTRTTGDLARAIALQRGVPEPCDLNALVEQAVGLARHRLAGDCELSIDTAALPTVRAAPGELVLLMATLIARAADGSRGGAGDGIAITTRRERLEGGDDHAVVRIAGGGAAPATDAAALLARRVLAGSGGELREGAEEGVWVAEMRIPVPR